MSAGRMLWAGRILTGLLVAFLLFDGLARLSGFAPYVEGTVRSGFPETLAGPIGMLLVLCTVLYAIPRTSILGGLLLTAYLGAATAIHVQLGDTTVFPVLMGTLVWAALLLREPRLRGLLPLRTS